MSNPGTRLGYESLSESVIIRDLGMASLRSLTSEMIRAWYSGLGNDTPRRNSHAYGLLHAILATVVKGELIDRNPCQIEWAMSTNRKREPVILAVPDVKALADDIGERWVALVLLSAWCGLCWAEVAELRRGDFGPGCETVTVSRTVNHPGGCQLDTTKSGRARIVVSPPHIRADIKAQWTHRRKAGADALLSSLCGAAATWTTRRSTFALEASVRIHEARYLDASR